MFTNTIPNFVNEDGLCLSKVRPIFQPMKMVFQLDNLESEIINHVNVKVFNKKVQLTSFPFTSFANPINMTISGLSFFIPTTLYTIEPKIHTIIKFIHLCLKHNYLLLL